MVSGLNQHLKQNLIFYFRYLDKKFKKKRKKKTNISNNENFFLYRLQIIQNPGLTHMEKHCYKAYQVPVP